MLCRLTIRFIFSILNFILLFQTNSKRNYKKLFPCANCNNTILLISLSLIIISTSLYNSNLSFAQNFDEANSDEANSDEEGGGIGMMIPGSSGNSDEDRGGQMAGSLGSSGKFRGTRQARQIRRHCSAGCRLRQHASSHQSAGPPRPDGSLDHRYQSVDLPILD